MIPEHILPEWTLDAQAVCDLSQRWMIDVSLAARLARLASLLPFPISIISGYRTPEAQRLLEKEGKGAPVDVSTHTSCPATGADLWPGVEPNNQVKIVFGSQVRVAGMRWGGGSPVDPDTGIPSDWNHVDLGPRHS